MAVLLGVFLRHGGLSTRQSPGARRSTQSKRNAKSQPEGKVKRRKELRTKIEGRILARESIRLTDVSSYVQWFLRSRNAGYRLRLALWCHCVDSCLAFTFVSQSDAVPDPIAKITGARFFPHGTL